MNLFFGGGIFFISLRKQGRISRAVIADLNSELVSFYRVVKRSPGKLIDTLYDDAFENSAAARNRMKDEFTGTVPERENAVRRAALFIFLNKHGYNGLWRVNSKGKFNVPFGCYAKRNIPSAVSIHLFSAILRQVTILNTDFEKAVRTARKGDFIYFDPPYLPLSKTARFTGYNCTGFTFEDEYVWQVYLTNSRKKGCRSC